MIATFEDQLAERRALDGSCIVPEHAPADVQDRLRSAAFAATRDLLDDGLHLDWAADGSGSVAVGIPGHAARLRAASDPYGLFVLTVELPDDEAHLELAPRWLDRVDLLEPTADRDAA